MPPERVVHVLHQVTGALVEAHGLELVHRDIKPANVMLTSQGGVPDVAKVVDFGLVKPMSGGVEPGVTTDNAIVGTPLCLAPEVIRGDSDCPAAQDLYALGCVGYFLLTGTHVFTADSPVQVCAMHLKTPPELPSKRLGTAVPQDLEELLLELLAKQVGDRPESAAQLLRRLERCACFAEWTQTDARRWWRKWGPELRERRDARAREAQATTALTVDVQRRPDP
jgi:serine/threonine-protein kinase